jgi:hypothetical protein
VKIRSSTTKYHPNYPKPHRVRDFEAEAIAEQAKLDADVERLKRRGAALERERALLRAKLGYDIDWLCYLPSSAGSPEVMERTCQYLEDMRARIEAAGAKMWLCRDHDNATRVFEISKFRIFDGSVFCSGAFSDPKFRANYQGVSPDNITFAGDLDLLREIHTPEGCGSSEDLPAEARAAASSPKVFGLAGSICATTELASDAHAAQAPSTRAPRILRLRMSASLEVFRYWRSCPNESALARQAKFTELLTLC